MSSAATTTTTSTSPRSNTCLGKSSDKPTDNALGDVAAVAGPIAVNGSRVTWKKGSTVTVLSPARIFSLLCGSTGGSTPVANRSSPSPSTTSLTPTANEVGEALAPAVRSFWPAWYRNVVLTNALRHHPAGRALQTTVEGGGKSLGSGRFGTVCSVPIATAGYDPAEIAATTTTQTQARSGAAPLAATKRVERAKNGGVGHNECYILNELRDAFLVPRLTYGIVWMYRYLPGEKHDVAVLECADTNLWSRLAKGRLRAKTLRAIFLQVFHTLATIHARLPSFRHNDLKADNILLFENVTPAPETHHYVLGAYRWEHRERTLAKITDFDFACTSTIANPKVDTPFSRLFGCESTPNHFYDAHVFLNSVYRHARTLPKSIVKWIETCVPVHLRGETSRYLHYGRLVAPANHAHELRTATQLLLDPFFEGLSV